MKTLRVVVILTGFVLIAVGVLRVGVLRDRARAAREQIAQRLAKSDPTAQATVMYSGGAAGPERVVARLEADGGLTVVPGEEQLALRTCIVGYLGLEKGKTP